jgi:DNA primase
VPFHGEKSPSFIVSPTRQTYHCFGCGVHGDAIRFLTELHGMSFVEAVQDLAQQVGLQVPEDERSAAEQAAAAEQRQRQRTLSEVLERAAQHYRQHLKSSQRAIAYLKGRGLSGEIAHRFGLGYAPDGWHGLASAFAHYDDPLLVESGLVILQGEAGEEQRRYDRFRDRIMFPIRNVKGETIAFGGRVLDKGEPKYLNSPETPVFVKGRELYGLYEARSGLRDKGYALVTEGYMDVVALAQLGFPNAVATLGTACTADHVHKLLRFTEQVVFSFDGDAAGRRAAGRALEAALPHATTRAASACSCRPSTTRTAMCAPSARGLRRPGARRGAAVAPVAGTRRRGLRPEHGRGPRPHAGPGEALWLALPEGALKPSCWANWPARADCPSMS